MKKSVVILWFLGVLIAFSPASAAEHIVNVLSGKGSEMRFEPKALTIQRGDTVTWINQSAVYHNVRALKKDIPDGATQLKSPGLRKEGDQWSYTFDIKGHYSYFCVPHRAMGMTGTVTVE